MSAVYTLDKIFDSLMSEYDSRTYGYSYGSTEYYQSSNDTSVTLEMPLPGISKDNLKVNVEEKLLTVEAQPDVKSRAVKPFKKSWSLSSDIDVAKISAKLENGLLTLVLPKVKPVKKSVSITVS